MHNTTVGLPSVKTACGGVLLQKELAAILPTLQASCVGAKAQGQGNCAWQMGSYWF